MKKEAISILVVMCALGASAPLAASECDAPEAEWLACEDFEGGSAGWDAWFGASPWVECLGCSDGNTENPRRIMLDDSQARDGDWSLYMPASADANYRGASLTWRSCEGEKRSGCTLSNYETLYYRAWVRLAPDHRYVHHFMSIAGTQPDQYWGADGNAGCRPNGARAAGTTVDFNDERELFFYTYHPEMNCDSGGYCSGDFAQNICDGCAQKDMACSDGLECCWGNHFATEPRLQLERDRWVCLEMMMSLNTPGQADGEMAFWVDGVLGHREQDMHWRDVPELGLNKVWVQHFIADGDTDQSNRIWWDDIVISTERIGCSDTPVDDPAPGEDPGGDTDPQPDEDPIGETGEDPASGGPDAPEASPDEADPEVVGTGSACSAVGSMPSLMVLLIAGLGVLRRRKRT